MSTTRPPSRTMIRAALAALAWVGLAGCAKKDGAESRYPEAERSLGDSRSIDDLEDALHREERRLRSAGVSAQPRGGSATSVGSGSGPPSAPASDDMGEAAEAPTAPETAPNQSPRRGPSERRCADVCGLATSICGLESQICGLASRHPGEPRYHQVCARAGDDCRSAEEACDVCR